MSLKNIHSFIFLSAIFVFSSCKKSDSGPGAQPDPGLSITAISPSSGRSATLDTIKGTDFTTLDSVFINGKSANIVSFSDTQLVVKVPPQAGTGNVSVTTGEKSVTGPVFTFTGNTYVVSTFAGSGTRGYAEGKGTAASFYFPTYITKDSHDNLYVTESTYNTIRKITPDAVVSTFAGSGALGSADGTAFAASFYYPYGIASDANDNLYVAETGGNKIRKITPGGFVSTLAGSGAQGSKDATGTTASFYAPQGVAVDAGGNVFVADSYNFKIRKITPDGIVSTFAGSGVQGFGDGISGYATFDEPNGINFDPAGNLYVADVKSNTIRKINSSGTVFTIAGRAGVASFADGTGTLAMFNLPTAVAVDKLGFIYVTDAENFVIRQISPSGEVTVLAGIVGSFGGNDGSALNASFFGPESLVIDSHGNIFVVDAGTSTIRKLTPQ